MEESYIKELSKIPITGREIICNDKIDRFIIRGGCYKNMPLEKLRELSIRYNIKISVGYIKTQGLYGWYIVEGRNFEYVERAMDGDLDIDEETGEPVMSDTMEKHMKKFSLDVKKLGSSGYFYTK